jgi:hypothetical protein
LEGSTGTNQTLIQSIRYACKKVNDFIAGFGVCIDCMNRIHNAAYNAAVRRAAAFCTLYGGSTFLSESTLFYLNEISSFRLRAVRVSPMEIRTEKENTNTANYNYANIRNSQMATHIVLPVCL